jgi:hypothetical protein
MAAKQVRDGQVTRYRRDCHWGFWPLGNTAQGPYALLQPSCRRNLSWDRLVVQQRHQLLEQTVSSMISLHFTAPCDF